MRLANMRSSTLTIASCIFILLELTETAYINYRDVSGENEGVNEKSLRLSNETAKDRQVEVTCSPTWGISLPQAKDPNRPSVNLAYYKPTYQSSNYYYIPQHSDGCAYHAVDGVRDSSFFSGNPMFHVRDSAEGPNWMLVDLLEKYKIDSVVVYNRLDCCSEREDNLIIGLPASYAPGQQINRGSYPLCGTYPGSALGIAILEIKCDINAPASQFVVAQQPANGKGLLQFAEIEVYGSPVVNNICPSGFDDYPAGDRCYKLITEMKDWYEHSKTCNSFGPLSHLVMINTVDNQIHTENYLNTKKEILFQRCMNKNPPYLKVWTSGQRQNAKDSTSAWVWRPFANTWTPMTATDWLPGEPNNAHGKESCIHLKFGANNDYKWNDSACSTADGSYEYLHAYDNDVIAMCALCEINFS